MESGLAENEQSGSDKARRFFLAFCSVRRYGLIFGISIFHIFNFSAFCYLSKVTK